VVNIDVVLNRVVPRLGIKRQSPGLNKAPGKSENTSATNHRHLPHLLSNGASPRERDGATVVLSFGQHKVRNHQKGKLLL